MPVGTREVTISFVLSIPVVNTSNVAEGDLLVLRAGPMSTAGEHFHAFFFAEKVHYGSVMSFRLSACLFFSTIAPT